MKKYMVLLAAVLIVCSSFQKGKKRKAAPVPACVPQLITKFKKEPVQNPPRSIYSYNYNGKTVYYVQAICCDFFSDLYDSNCAVIGHPDGGFTGRGDGKFSDFNKEKKNEKLIWKDTR
jgi:hypothetical protein